MTPLMFPWIPSIISQNVKNYKHPTLFVTQSRQLSEAIHRYNLEINRYNLLVLRRAFNVKHMMKFKLSHEIEWSSKKVDDLLLPILELESQISENRNNSSLL